MADVPSLRLFKEKINELIGKDTELNKKISDGDNALGRRIDGKLGKTETAVRATADGNGNNIPNTYATIDYVDRNISNLVKKIDNFVITDVSIYHPGDLGITAHWDVNYPDIRNMTATITLYRGIYSPISTTMTGSQLASGHSTRDNMILFEGVERRDPIKRTEIALSDGSVYSFDTPIGFN